MKTILLFAVLILSILSTSCNNSNVKSDMVSDTIASVDTILANSKVKTDDNPSVVNAVPFNIETRMMDTIFSLPEMKELDKFLRKETKGERNLKIWIAGTPQDSDGFYYVKAGEDNGDNYVAHHNFLIDPNTMTIKYDDVVNEKLVTLDEWRRMRNQ